MNKTIGKNLSLMRELNPFPIEDIARYLGLSTVEYQQMESGEYTPTTSLLEKAAKLFGFDEIHFFDETKEDLQRDMLACAFDGGEVTQDDMHAIANFKRSFMNYLKIKSKIK